MDGVPRSALIVACMSCTPESAVSANIVSRKISVPGPGEEWGSGSPRRQRPGSEWLEGKVVKAEEGVEDPLISLVSPSGSARDTRA
jgi:hypothetical protein